MPEDHTLDRSRLPKCIPPGWWQTMDQLFTDGDTLLIAVPIIDADNKWHYQYEVVEVVCNEYDFKMRRIDGSDSEWEESDVDFFVKLND